MDAAMESKDLPTESVADVAMTGVCVSRVLSQIPTILARELNRASRKLVQTT
jgi:hypothetical protein